MAETLIEVRFMLTCLQFGLGKKGKNCITATLLAHTPRLSNYKLLKENNWHRNQGFQKEGKMVILQTNATTNTTKELNGLYGISCGSLVLYIKQMLWDQKETGHYPDILLVELGNKSNTKGPSQLLLSDLTPIFQYDRRPSSDFLASDFQVLTLHYLFENAILFYTFFRYFISLAKNTCSCYTHLLSG